MPGGMGYNCDMRLSKSDPVLWFSIGAATLLLLTPLPFEGAFQRWPTLMSELENFGHPLVMAWLAHLAFRRLRGQIPPPSRAAYLWVLGLAIGYGALTEVIQSFTGRDASGWDLLNDVVGAAFAVLLNAGREASSHHLRRMLLAVAALTALTVTTPLLITVAAYITRSVREPVLWNDRSPLLGRFSHWRWGFRQALIVEEPLPHWREWRFLEIDLRNLQPAPQRLVVRVHDRNHDQSYGDRYNGQFTLAPQTRETLRIPLDRIRTAPAAREMDMDAIRGIVVFSVSGPGRQTRAFHVYEIRLAR